MTFLDNPYPIPNPVPDPKISDRSVGSEEEILSHDPPSGLTASAVLDSPTDRERASRAGFEGEATEDLRVRIFEAIRAGRYDESKAIREELQARAVERRTTEVLEREARLAEAGRLEAAAAARGGVCDLTAQGCSCKGRLDYRHQRFIEDLRRPRITPETQAAIAELLGYPPKGARMKSIFGGTFGNGPTVAGFEWAMGALEEDWLTVLELAQRPPGKNGGPRRNLRDGSVSEGWVRAVLQNEIARRVGS